MANQSIYKAFERMWMHITSTFVKKTDVAEIFDDIDAVTIDIDDAAEGITLEPNVPLKKRDKETGDTLYIYPQTTAGQIKVDNGERLNAVLDKVLYHGNDDEDIDIDDIGYVEVNLDGVAENDVVIPINADTLGGYHPGRYRTAYNLLDNSDFRNPVNQRGATSYSGAGYWIDRFDGEKYAIKIQNDGVSFSQSSEDVTNSYIRQKLPWASNSEYIGKICTFAVCVNDTICLISGKISAAKQGHSNSKFFNVDGVQIKLVFEWGKTNDFANIAIVSNSTTPVVLKWAALYEGEYTAETLPEYIPKGYAHELLECQRYYLSLFGSDAYQYLYTGQALTTTRAFIPIPLSVPFIKVPTISFTNGVGVTSMNGGIEENISSISISKFSNRALLLDITLDSERLVAGNATILSVRTATGKIELSADL
jgi:hypothetical protein